MRKVIGVALVLVVVILIVGLTLSLSLAPLPEHEDKNRSDSLPAGAVKWTPALDQHPPVLHSDLWMEPVPLAGPVNTAGAEDSAFILPDGSALYFFFTPDTSVEPQGQLFDGVTGIWRSDWNGVGWSESERVWLQDPGKLALDGAAFILGDELWFASAREGYTDVNLFTARWSDGEWTDWSYAGDRLNEQLLVGEMHITADGQRMYFHSERTGTLGGLDIWYMDKISGEWQVPVNVQAVNTAGNEGWPFISQDGNELWFTRTYQGSPGIFRSLMVNSSWTEAELVLSSFAGEPTMDQGGNLYFTHHYYQDSVMMEADIYVAYRK